MCLIYWEILLLLSIEGCHCIPPFCIEEAKDVGVDSFPHTQLELVHEVGHEKGVVVEAELAKADRECAL